jgi:flavine halogenase
VGKRRKQDELDNVIKFCGTIFLPTDQALHDRVAARLDSKLLDTKGPIVTSDEIDRLVPDDVEAQLVLKEINGHKASQSASASVGSFSDEIVEGYSARVTRGNIGLISHTSNAMSSAIPLSATQVGKKDYFSFSHLLFLLSVVVPLSLLRIYSWLIEV